MEPDNIESRLAELRFLNDFGIKALDKAMNAEISVCQPPLKFWQKTTANTQAKREVGTDLARENGLICSFEPGPHVF